ncbi:GntR family transcriptional regulator [Janibacter limosus]|uniref:GntR family transcriptional regulator n=1 Tax=Janibacter limosus TaxID=53458 RepID=A0AC61U2K4_9MICO|nr:GntR family transcriptional regulator [Janibacter limosus]UUZ44198.1 GntR family transcriptional regulator [Janibacter limosus]
MARSDGVYESLRSRILSGEHAPGSRLPEESLSEVLGVSRTPVRSALHRLADEGLVVLEPRRGAFVAEFTRADVDEVFELRGLLERRAAARAALHRSADRVTRLSELVEEMHRLAAQPGPSRRDDLHHNNRDFHELVLAAAESPRQFRITMAPARTSLTPGSFFDYEDEDIERSVHFHRMIARAVADGRAELAGDLMAAHIGMAHRSFVGRRFAVPGGAVP